MTEQEKMKLQVQFEMIADYVTDIAIDIDNIVHDDITATEEMKKEMMKGTAGNAYKLWLAVKDLKKQLDKVVTE